HHQLSGMMIERFGMHGPDQSDLVDARADLRESRGNLNARFSVTLKFVRAAEQHRAVFLQKSETNVFREGVGQFFAVHLVQLWFWIEQIDLAGASLHEQKNALLRFRREMRWTHRQRVES